MDFEYLENDRSTWRFHPPPLKPVWFEKELIDLAGLNRHSQPNLRLIWGGTELSDRTEEKGRLKYQCGWTPETQTGWKYQLNGKWCFTENIDNLDKSVMVFPVIEQEELGLMRWIIEQWTSPEELEAQHRFENRCAPEESEVILREFPREGIYDCYFIIQNVEGLYRPIDRDVVDFIRQKWHFEQNSNFEEAEKLRQAIADREQIALLSEKEEVRRAALNFELKLDPEDKARSEEYWAKLHGTPSKYI